MVFSGACTVPPSNAPTVATTNPTSPPVTSPPVSPTAAPVQVPFTVCSADEEDLEALTTCHLQGEAGGFETNGYCEGYCYCGGAQLQITASTDQIPFTHWMLYAESAEGTRIGSWNVSGARQPHNAAVDASGAYCDPLTPASTVSGAGQESAAPFVHDWSPPLEDSGPITFRGVFRHASLDAYMFSTLTIEPDPDCGWSATAPPTAEPTTPEPTTSEPTTSAPMAAPVIDLFTPGPVGHHCTSVSDVTTFSQQASADAMGSLAGCKARCVTLGPTCRRVELSR